MTDPYPQHRDDWRIEGKTLLWDGPAGCYRARIDAVRDLAGHEAWQVRSDTGYSPAIKYRWQVYLGETGSPLLSGASVSVSDAHDAVQSAIKAHIAAVMDRQCQTEAAAECTRRDFQDFLDGR
ncbi:MAG: hypothetical protein OXU67_10310 [Chloroflexota bacterium]|nr:hypothetical protein [Chloroflexota bacterium]